MHDRPARVGDLRGLRRWLLVAAVWATAATAIAVIALIAAKDAKDAKDANTEAAAAKALGRPANSASAHAGSTGVSTRSRAAWRTLRAQTT